MTKFDCQVINKNQWKTWCNSALQWKKERESVSNRYENIRIN